MTRDTISRRRVLAAVGSVGLLAATARVGRASFGLGPVEFSDQLQIERDGPMPDVLLNWRETYNGTVVESSDYTTPPTPGPAGPIVDIDNVLPGDSGSLTLQVELGADSEATSESARISLYVDVYENLENGIREPEEKAGDTTESDGEMADAVELELRYDDGCNAVDIPLIPDDRRIAAGTATAVATQLSNGIRLQPPSPPCFTIGDSTCLTLEWALPDDVGNAVQSDSLGVSLRFAPEPCPGGDGGQ